MKSILYLLSFLVCTTAFSQTSNQENPTSAIKNVETSPLTEVMLRKYYSSDDIQEMKTNASNKIESLDYYYSKSFKVKDGQTYTKDQLLKIDITKLDDQRLSDKTVEVLDENSQLYLVLDSHSTLKATINKIMKVD